MQSDTDYRLKPSPDLLRIWRTASLILWLISSPLYAIFIAPVIDPRLTVFLPTGFWTPVAMALPSLGLGLLIAIAQHRTAPLARVLRPTRARLLGAIGFWLVMPVAVIGIFPFSAGFVGITAFRQAGFGLSGDAGYSTISAALLGVSYIIACLLSYGLPQIVKRFAAYVLIWGGCVSIVTAAGMLRIFTI